jgi:hypothetical protein
MLRKKAKSIRRSFKSPICNPQKRTKLRRVVERSDLQLERVLFSQHEPELSFVVVSILIPRLFDWSSEAHPKVEFLRRNTIMSAVPSNYHHTMTILTISGNVGTVGLPLTSSNPRLDINPKGVRFS